MYHVSTSGTSAAQSLDLSELGHHFGRVPFETIHDRQIHQQHTQPIFTVRSVGHHARPLSLVHFRKAFRAITGVWMRLRRVQTDNRARLRDCSRLGESIRLIHSRNVAWSQMYLPRTSQIVLLLLPIPAISTVVSRCLGLFDRGSKLLFNVGPQFSDRFVYLLIRWRWWERDRNACLGC